MSEGEMVTVLRERLDAFKKRERVSWKECLEVFGKKRIWFHLLKKHFGWKNNTTVLDGYGIKKGVVIIAGIVFMGTTKSESEGTYGF